MLIIARRLVALGVLGTFIGSDIAYSEDSCIVPTQAAIDYEVAWAASGQSYPPAPDLGEPLQIPVRVHILRPNATGGLDSARIPDIFDSLNVFYESMNWTFHHVGTIDTWIDSANYYNKLDSGFTDLISHDPTEGAIDLVFMRWGALSLHFA